MKNQRNHARHSMGLVLALIGLIGAATLELGPTRLASAQANASWSYTGNLNAARAVHTATLLPNGKALVVGGRDFNPGGGVFNSAELYDSSTGMWTSTGNLNTGRFAHAATLLLNGKVLVVGGYNGLPLNVLNSAELYDPATATWSITGNLNVPRAGWHTATLLPNGKVLVVGGIVDRDNAQTTSSAELYDPASGTWTSTGSLQSNQMSPAMLLPNGKVLVFDWDDNAELYDPATGTWSITVHPNPFRYSYTTTVLQNGKVLLLGGIEYDCFGICPSNSVELYDPDTGAWTSAGNLDPADAGNTMLLLSGKVLVFGGRNAQLYDPAAGTWSLTANINTSRVAPTATLLSNGKVLVAGGNVSGGPGTLNTAELYDPGTNSPNQIDDTQFFVRQHYRDFLSREPDTDGLNFWTSEIFLCAGDAQCIETKRINVSAAFYLSIEFQQTGYLVERIYKASYSDGIGSSTLNGTHQLSVPIVRMSEFVPDTHQISQGVVVLRPGWEQVLENNKQAFAVEFVQRSRFTAAFPSTMTAAEFVDKLNSNSGSPLSQTEHDHLVSDLAAGAKTRAQVLRAIAEDADLVNAEFNRAFVLMQYFGYLRRNANDAPDSDYSGYDYWLTKLNQFNGNFGDAEMVKAFLSSIEYRRRFGP